MSRALVLFAHPLDDSFSAALHRTTVETLTARGWQVDDCDLYAEGFNPVLSAEERRLYHDTTRNIAPVHGYVDRLRAADALVLVFPVWNYGFPAILKGYFDRVFLPGVSFDLREGRVAPALTNIQKLAAITTYGGTRLRSFLAGDPPRRIVKRTMSRIAQAGKTRYLALYDMNNVTKDRTSAFLSQVRSEMEAF
ncbi:NAD(P)H-dependent oxidoreductase [Neotabrizicola shimadae]|uniref:NAD(P)H-dependent oxidoreductase n=1 Tax=Neotabrizicola shimadae TaxID=2807096 RepID=A0A8G0ZUY4_9RHOB|nr:NAD(P)H-dependent oxidoreductase [Neotabrizicola shimadae]QYZ69105.1 NAD(P)H-dependent oxidoreductase [Neotabrizicola shimadae]